MLVYKDKKQKVKPQTQGIKGVHEFVITNPDGSIKERFVKENLITDAGLGMAGQILAGLVPDSEGINYCGLGTGSTAVATSDTQMESEGDRKIRGSSQSSGTQFIVAFYFNPDEGNGTWTRYATFIDGTDTVDTGTLYTHVDISLTKASGEGLTINSQYTVVDL